MMEISAEQRKEYIVLISIDLIHENGIDHVSTKEIAKRLNISEALIFKYFSKKSEIFKAVLDLFVRYDKDLFATANFKNENILEDMMLSFNILLRYYENYPAITSIYQAYYSFHNEPELKALVTEIFMKRSMYIRQLIEKAQEKHWITQNYNSEMIADILSSTIRGMCLKWRMKDYSFSLRDETLQVIKVLLASFTA